MIDKGAENAAIVARYAVLSHRLRSISKTIVGPSKKEILAIASELEALPESLFKSAFFKAYLATRSPKLEKAKSDRASPSLAQPIGGGPELTNENLSNDERMDESIRVVKSAVATLRETEDWAKLKVREKIRLLKAETLKARGAEISSQTLYRPWIRGLW